jgi:hypothetical protein
MSYPRIKFVYLVILSFWTTTLLAQNSAERKIVFIDMRQKENSQLWKYKKETLSNWVYRGINANELTTYFVDYKNQAQVKTLPLWEWKNIAIGEPDKSKVWNPNTTYDSTAFGIYYDGEYYYSEKKLNKGNVPSDSSAIWINLNTAGISFMNEEQGFCFDFETLGLDQTIVLSKDNYYSQVHFVSFYAKKYDDKGNKSYHYSFSIKWEDFLLFLKKKNKLYYTCPFSNWWRGDVFVTNSAWAIDLALAYDFIKLGEENLSLKLSDYYNPKIRYTSGKDDYMELFFTEAKKDSVYTIIKAGGELIDQPGDGIKKDRFIFNWSDFLKIAKDSSWRKKSELCYISEAFNMQKFPFSSKISPITISQNGKFPDGSPDLLCNDKITPSFSQAPREPIPDRLCLDFVEWIDMKDSLNKKYYEGDNNPVGIILDLISKGKLTSYLDESLSATVKKEEVKRRIQDTYSVYEYYLGNNYKKGDIIEYNKSYYVAKRDIPSNISDVFNKTGYFEPYQTKEYSTKELTVLHVKHLLKFNKEGKNKRYITKAMGIYIPENISSKGILIPVCYVKWEDLKKILLQNNNLSLIEWIANRNYFSYFNNTGQIEIEN